MRSGAPAESPGKENGAGTVDWAADARRVIELLPNDAIKPLLIDTFEETASLIEREQRRTRPEAEQQAFGLLLFHILRHGMDVEVPR